MINILIYLNKVTDIITLQKSIENQLIRQMKQLKRDDFINDYRFDGWKSDNECKITFIPKMPLQYINIGFTILPSSTNFN